MGSYAPRLQIYDGVQSFVDGNVVKYCLDNKSRQFCLPPYVIPAELAPHFHTPPVMRVGDKNFDPFALVSCATSRDLWGAHKWLVDNGAARIWDMLPTMGMQDFQASGYLGGDDGLLGPDGGVIQAIYSDPSAWGISNDIVNILQEAHQEYETA